MGFGKFLFGGVCAVGAAMAAPILVPAVGTTLIASSIGGGAAVTAGFAMATASSTALATGAAVTAGAAGVAGIKKVEENLIDKGREEGRQENETYYNNVIEGKNKIINDKDEMIKILDEDCKDSREMAERAMERVDQLEKIMYT